MHKQLKFLDLFSGIGGFRYPLEQLGHICVGYSEINKYALQTYRTNFNTDNEVYLGDITQVDTDTLPDFDLLTAGFPCQAFSIAGERKGFQDTRGTLFFEVARILKARQPKWFILENVKGLISHGKPPKSKGYKSLVNPAYNGKERGIGRTLQIIEETLVECGYNFTWQVLNTKDYLLPQNRERIIFVGQHKDLGPFSYAFPPAEPLILCVRDLLESEVDEKFYLSEKMQKKILQQLLDKENIHLHRDIRRNEVCSKVLPDGTVRFFQNDKKKSGLNELQISPAQGIANAIIAGHIPKIYYIDSLNVGSIVDDRHSDLRLYEKISPTLRAERQGLYVVPTPQFICGLGPVRRGCKGQEALSRAYRQKDRLYSALGISPTICSSEQSGRYHFLIIDDNSVRIFENKQKVKKIANSNPSGRGLNGAVYDVNNGLVPIITPNKGEGNKICYYVEYKTPETDQTEIILLPQLRKLTPKECFRLQGFPDWFVDNAKKAGVSDTQLYRQAGNAVSTTVILRVMQQLEKLLN